jgi:uncharacterized protein YbjT (DUF2867 family)
MRTLVAGASGYVGSTLIPPLLDAGHEVVALGRDPARVRLALGEAAADVELARGEMISGAGLDRALCDVDVADYLVHSMERSDDGPFGDRERRAAEVFGAAARRAGVRRIVYLGGLVPEASAVSPHLASRLRVERLLLEAVPDSLALRASIVIGARSRSFRLLVRLVERMPMLALPAWRRHRTQPLDERDAIAFLLAAAGASATLGGRSLDVGCAEVVRYEEIIECIADRMLVRRPSLRLPMNLTPVAAPIAAAIAGEDPELILPLMEGLDADLLLRDSAAAGLLGVHLHRFEAAVEHALREWERREELRAR